MKSVVENERCESEPLHLADVSLHTGESGYMEKRLWASLTSAASTQDFAKAWLELQSRIIGGVQRAVVVLGAADKGTYAPVAHWPADSSESQELMAVAERAMAEQRGTLRVLERIDSDETDGHHALAYPVLVDDRLCGVVAIIISHRSEDQLAIVMRQLQWGCAWLDSLIRRKTLGSRDRLVRQAKLDVANFSEALDLMVLLNEEKRYVGAAMTFCNEIAARYKCERTSLGWLKGAYVRVQAISHMERFEKKMEAVQSLADRSAKARSRESANSPGEAQEAPDRQFRVEA